MRHRNRVVTALAAVTVSAALAACGSSDSENKSDLVSGQFKLVPGAPAGFESLAGEATLERADGGTAASLRLTGLEPKTAYVAHLHSEGCDQADPGGPHFKFDPAGGEEPPNEIHLEFSSDAAGSVDAKASSNREVPVGEAGSIVLHEAGDDHMAAFAPEDGGEAVFVHEGHHHDEGATEGEEHSPPAKIACAELEGGGSGGDTATIIPTIEVRNGEPVGGIRELEYSAGEEIRFRVESDVADEVHIHGYDLMEDVPANGTVDFDFPAEIEGIFEVELEGRKEQIAELQVNP
jgi:hypothetical protein